MVQLVSTKVRENIKDIHPPPLILITETERQPRDNPLPRQTNTMRIKFSKSKSILPNFTSKNSNIAPDDQSSSASLHSPKIRSTHTKMSLQMSFRVDQMSFRPQTPPPPEMSFQMSFRPPKMSFRPSKCRSAPHRNVVPNVVPPLQNVVPPLKMSFRPPPHTRPRKNCSAT